MWFSLKHSISFHHMLHHHLHLYLLCPNFSDSSKLVKQFKPSVLYERHCHHPPGALHDSAPTLDPVIAPTLDLIMFVLPLHRSTRSSKPHDWYGFFTLVSLSTILSSIYIPFSYTQAIWIMNVGKRQYKKSYRHFKKITLGTICLVLLWSNLLEVNGCSLSSFILMAHWIVIKLD